jgi:hypothetical protein
MTDSSATGQRTVTVTLDLTDDDVYAVLVNSLRAAADEAQERADREGEGENPNEDWSEDQERMAQIGRALVENIETQIDAQSAAQEKSE